jgi:hypothetical protein
MTNRAPLFLENLATMPHDTRALFDKIRALPPERIAEVEDFVDFIALRTQDLALTRAATSFAKVWENPEDDAYDGL